jgi:peptidoglycan-binding protein ArfA
MIVGYTDDLGSAQHGLVLSRRRAAAVARVLRPQLDKTDYTFSVSGRAEADPAVPSTSEKNRKLNRRVELTDRRLAKVPPRRPMGYATVIYSTIA